MGNYKKIINYTYKITNTINKYKCFASLNLREKKKYSKGINKSSYDLGCKIYQFWRKFILFKVTRYIFMGI
jgi:hypothetical protein